MSNRLQRLGEQTFNRLDKINSELFTLTYGSFVLQLLEDFEDVNEVNIQLEKIGFKMGQRLIDEYFSKSNAGKCKNFKDTAEHITKVGFKMFLGITAKPCKYGKNKSGDVTSFSVTFEDNPLINFVELPDKYKKDLIYSNLLCGVLRGCLDMVQMKVECKYVKSPLKDNVDYSEIKVVLKKIVKESVSESPKKKMGILHPFQLFFILALLTASVLQSLVKLQEVEVISDLFVLISDQDIPGAWNLLLSLLLWFSVDIFFEVILASIGVVFQYTWRKNLVKNLLNEYFKEKNYYVILHLKENKVDNPPQRIHSDATDFVINLSLTLTGFTPLFIQILLNTYFIIQSNSSYLLIPVFFWPVLDIVMFGLLFTPISKQIWKKDKLEGNFRFAHARIREHCESISFFKSDNLEKKNVETIFSKLIAALIGLASRFYFYNVWSMCSSNLPTVSYILSLFLMITFNAPPFTATMTSQVLTKYITKLFQLSSLTGTDISGIFGLSQYVSVVMGSTARVGGLCEAFKKKEKGGGVFIEDDSQIYFHNVQVRTPNNKILLDKFEHKIEEGNSLLIMGESGCGKSSLLRVLAGLWKIEHGVITKPFKIGEGGLFFLPQKPYLIKGSLKMNIVYPRKVSEVNISDSKLEKILEIAQIGYLAKRASLHEECLNWDEKLSVGEQQRVGIARLVFHRPLFAVCDESTSALDSETQEKVYENLVLLGITLISVAHRKTVIKYHKQVLLMKNDNKGGYEIKDVKEEMIPKYSDKWECKKEYKATEEEKKDFEITNTVDIEKDDKNLGKTGLNYTFVKRLCRLLFCGIMIKSWKEWVFLILNCLMTIVLSLSALPLILLSSSVLGALSGREILSTLIYVFVYAIFFIILIIISSITNASWMIIGIFFRKNLTEYFHKKYFSNQLFYKANIIDKSIDNIDQRICNDVDAFTSGFPFSPGLSFLLSIYIVCFTTFFSTFLSALLSLGVSLVVGLVLVVIAAVVQIFIMILIARIRFLQQKKEGYFRISLERLKEYSEQICFYNGIEREKELVMARFDTSLWNQLFLAIVVAVNTLLIKIVDAISKVMAFFVFLVSVQFGFISLVGLGKEEIITLVQTGSQSLRNTVASGEGIMSASTLLSNSAGYVGRISQLIEKFDELQPSGKKKKHGFVRTKDSLVFKNVTCQLPNMKKLFFNVSFRINKKESLLIKGPSGCGKSSLLRMMGNLWPIVEGGIIGCPNIIGSDGLFFSPQKPYILLSGLKQNIIYPDEKSKLKDEELLEILKRVNLGYIYKRLDNWETKASLSTILSEGEKQRLSFARILYHRPLFAILDESTSALDEKNEKLMHDECKKIGTNFLSVGHRQSVEDFHNLLLTFDGKGSWSFSVKKGEKDLKKEQEPISEEIIIEMN